MAHGSGLANVLATLNQRGIRLRSHGGYYTTHCPAHEDRTASLSIRQGEKGAVLNCHAGCPTDAIRAELGLEWPALFDNEGGGDSGRGHASDLWMPCQAEKRDPRDPEPCPGHKEAEYRYTDADGNLLFGVARCSRKGQGCQGFRQWVPDASKKFGKRWSIPADVPRVLYDLPRVVRAARARGRIYLVEGEKDAERMKTDFPEEVATTQPSGAGSNKWRPENTKYFMGASEVIIIADCDKPGLEYATEAHYHLSKVVDRVTVVCTPLLENGADFSDHRNYGLGLDDFESVEVKEIEHRPQMVITVEQRHREKPVIFDGYSQADVEASLLGSMLKYGTSYEISMADIRSKKELQLVAGAIGRIAARGSTIAPMTVAAEIEASGHGTYDQVLGFLANLERTAFSDTEKPKAAAEILRQRSMREGLVYSCRAVEEAARNERWPVGDVLAYMGRLAQRHGEEYAEIGRAYGESSGDAFTVDIVEEIAREVVAEETNVHPLRPVARIKPRESAARLN